MVRQPPIRPAVLVWLIGLFLYRGPPVRAIRPPHPNDTGYESLRDYRKRLGIDYQYVTRYIHPDLCRTLTEDRCRSIDEADGAAYNVTRRFLTPQSRRQMRQEAEELMLKQRGDGWLQPPLAGGHAMDGTADDTTDRQQQQQQGGGGRTLQGDQSIGIGLEGPLEADFNVLVLLLVWSGQEDRINNPVTSENFRQFFNVGADPNLSPSGSVKEYLEAISYGQFSPTFTVAEWAVTDK
jgi:hypothetical protein